ncbi:MAG: hypothetical protein WBA59_01260 [Moheibacter sp.]
MKKPLIIISLIPVLSMNLLIAYWQLSNNEDLIKERSIKVSELVQTEISKNNKISTDTLRVEGKYVIFLRPSDEKYKSLEDQPGIYESDSDFGFGISLTIDSLETISIYSNIKNTVTVDRYIEILDCADCPKIIDRDTLFYGLILTATNQKTKTITNIHSMPYLDEIDEYFGLDRLE